MNASIYNNSGNQVMNIGDFVSNEFNTKQYKTVDTGSLINGVYYFVLTGNNKKITKPFIKN
jgi:hypothetical protein